MTSPCAIFFSVYTRLPSGEIVYMRCMLLCGGGFRGGVSAVSALLCGEVSVVGFLWPDFMVEVYAEDLWPDNVEFGKVAYGVLLTGSRTVPSERTLRTAVQEGA